MLKDSREKVRKCKNIKIKYLLLYLRNKSKKRQHRKINVVKPVFNHSKIGNLTLKKHSMGTRTSVKCWTSDLLAKTKKIAVDSEEFRQPKSRRRHKCQETKQFR